MGSYCIESDYEYLPGLFGSLTEVLSENRQYYLGVNDGKKSLEFSQCFQDLLEVTAKTLKLLLEVAAVSPLFDFDADTKGNGYRTIVRVIELCFRRLHALGQYFQKNRERLLFRSDHYYKEIVSYLDLSKGLFKFLEFSKLLLEWSEGNDLFPPEDHYDAKTMTDTHLHAMEKECFYGRRLGFHFNTALRGFLTTVCITMASFGDGYAKHDGSFTVAAASILNGPKYLINPDLRAKKLISLTSIVDMEFCKAFWTLSERYGLQHFPSLVSSSLKVNEPFEIPPVPLEVTTENGEVLIIEPPSSWIGFAPVNVHLLSYSLRKGQIGDKDGDARHTSHAKPKADGLVIHIHGGGFVAQSSISHEIYLRSWAKSLNVPILSIDYALAPELPFPRAVEECFFAYMWALNNFDRLGTTGKHIALVGDSAGGNLSVALCLKVASCGVRLPDGILTSYAPFMVQFRPSPSRLLTLLDPLLPVGILTSCLAAYTGSTGKSSDNMPSKTEADGIAENRTTRSGVSTESNVETDNISENGISKQNVLAENRTETTERFENTSGEYDSMKNYIKSSGTSENYTSRVCVSKGNQGETKGISENTTITKNRTTENDAVTNEITERSTSREHLSTPKCIEKDGVLENADIEYSPDNGCCCETHVLLPDVVQDSHCSSTTISDVDLLHLQRESVQPCATSDSVLPGEGHELNDLSSSAFLTDDHLVTMSKNPLMSPLVASKEELAKLPPIDLVACTMDPLLDDSIEFAKRLREVGNKVELYIVDDLPHGFLSFYMVCQEGREANNLCVACIKKILRGKREVGESCTPPIY